VLHSRILISSKVISATTPEGVALLTQAYPHTDINSSNFMWHVCVYVRLFPFVLG
jgi:hypothetical protein